MSKSFSLFIVSHGRARTMTTLNTIQRCGYTGDYRIIIDDEDGQADDYFELYGDKVIQFCKKEAAITTDTMINNDKRNSVVFARNECYNIAKRLGVDYFAEFDDDIKDFYIRYEQDGSLKRKKVTDFDWLIDAALDFMIETDASSFGFAHVGRMIGGLKGYFSKGLARQLHQAFILRTDKPIEFKGLINEDESVNMYENYTGNKLFEICSINIDSSPRGTVSGGLQNLYDSTNWYNAEFHTTMIAPSCATVKINDLETQDSSLLRYSKHIYPEIISDRYKK